MRPRLSGLMRLPWWVALLMDLAALVNWPVWTQRQYEWRWVPWTTGGVLQVPVWYFAARLFPVRLSQDRRMACLPVWDGWLPSRYV